MDLPERVEKGLEKFLDAARTAFGANLVSVVLYDSGAENKLRATSDVNVIAVVDSVTEAQMTAVGPTVAMLGAAIQLKVMFLRRSPRSGWLRESKSFLQSREGEITAFLLCSDYCSRSRRGGGPGCGGTVGRARLDA